MMNNQNSTNNTIKKYSITKDSSIKNLGQTQNIIELTEKQKKKSNNKTNNEIMRVTQALKLSNPFRGV
jgi:hypothetical protein